MLGTKKKTAGNAKRHQHPSTADSDEQQRAIGLGQRAHSESHIREEQVVHGRTHITTKNE